MLDKSSRSAHLSQFDGIAAPRRVVLLGASNLSLTFPMVVETALGVFGRPLEFYVAMGFGRSYGQESKFFRKKISGILQCDLWESLGRATPQPTAALVADVGNDLAYEAPTTTIVDWVSQSLDRLATYGAAVALNNVPLASLEGVGALRYGLMRGLFFPRCRLPRQEMLRRAGELDGALNRIAAERRIPVFSGENAWYGFDPIHPRRGSAHEIWLRMMTALAPAAIDAACCRPSRREERRLRFLQRRAWLSRAGSAHRPPAFERWADGTSIALF